MHKNKSFLERISEGVVLGDGAIGTRFYEMGVDITTCYDYLNIVEPEMVKNIHRSYLEAGSELIETNTFAANRYKLEKYGLEHKIKDINNRGAKLALEVAGDNAWVAGSVGPLGIDIAMSEHEELSAGDVEAIFREQIEILAESSVDVIILETFADLDEMLAAIRAAKSVSSLPIISQLVYPFQGRTMYGKTAYDCASACLEAGADIVGSNCGRGITGMIETVKQLTRIKDAPISVYANAGMPELQESRAMFMIDEDYFSKKVMEMVDMGATLVGGCCGTNQSHIAALARKISARKGKKSLKIPVAEVPSQVQPQEIKFKKGGFLDSLIPGQLPVIVEIDPPHHLDISHIMEGAKKIAEAGANGISLAENPLAILRMGNISLAHLIKRDAGIQTIVHMTCRDRNILGLQSALMGAHALEIEGMLAITGDPANFTDQPGAKGVFSINSFRLIEIMTKLNNGTNMSGKSIKMETNFSIAGALNFVAKHPDIQLKRLKKKVECGAQFMMTQPLFVKKDIEVLVEKTRDCHIPIFVGIYPLLSHKNAEFLHHEVPGINIPKYIRDRMGQYEDKNDQRKAGVDIAKELITDVKDIVDGIYIISPLNIWKISLSLLNHIRKG
ncbi:MAG: bifunctional homocysteine S-methyltransferase/methylenetetrahydrofolate reductase [Deltaproteobacteria bacterium]|nr:bifunctional homocysteine S-methyltransferase/methylenetetrahydrofolate reductase [Deltaproteobacteria bacterium]